MFIIQFFWEWLLTITFCLQMLPLIRLMPHDALPGYHGFCSGVGSIVPLGAADLFGRLAIRDESIDTARVPLARPRTPSEISGNRNRNRARTFYLKKTCYVSCDLFLRALLGIVCSSTAWTWENNSISHIQVNLRCT